MYFSVQVLSDHELRAVRALNKLEDSLPDHTGFETREQFDANCDRIYCFQEVVGERFDLSPEFVLQAQQAYFDYQRERSGTTVDSDDYQPASFFSPEGF